MAEICHFKDFFKVFTLFFPDLNLYSSPSSQVVTEGDTVNITCTAEGEPGLITFNKWSHYVILSMIKALLEKSTITPAT